MKPTHFCTRDDVNTLRKLILSVDGLIVVLGLAVLIGLQAGGH
jgi:hypothetical protein